MFSNVFHHLKVGDLPVNHESASCITRTWVSALGDCTIYHIEYKHK